MEVKNRFELVRKVGDILQKEMGKEVEDISSETNESTGRCDLLIEFKNGDTATLNLKMEDENGNSK